MDMKNSKYPNRSSIERPLPTPFSGDVPPRRGWVRSFKPFNPADLPSTFEEVVSRLDIYEQPELVAHTKSAFVRMGQVLRMPLSRIPTDPVALRQLIADAVPATDRKMTPKHWVRVRSLVTTHLRKCGIEIMPGRDVGGHSVVWADLLNGAPQPIQFGVSRFASYCTRYGIKPEGVTETTFEEFEAGLRERSLKEDYDRIFRNTVRRWNDAVVKVAGWPTLVVPIQRHARYFSQPWADFPESYVADVEAFLADAGGGDIWDEDYKAPRAATTISLRRRQLILVSSLLVSTGFPIENLISLSVLVTPQNAIAAFRAQQQRKQTEFSRSLEQCVWLLALIARDWVKAPEHADRLRNHARAISKKLGTQSGMTPRNKERLRQFDLDQNTSALLELPHRVFAEARKANTGGKKEARRIMFAFAVEMLLCAALRGANLNALELDRHFVVTGRGRQTARHIVIPACEMKGPDGLEMALPKDTNELMDEYLNVYWPRLAPAGSPSLFLNRFGKKYEKTHFAQAISDFIMAETGLVMNVHLFRHFSVKLHHKDNPEDMETPRQFLMHRNDKVTRMHYAENKPGRAFARYHQTVANARRKGRDAA